MDGTLVSLIVYKFSSCQFCIPFCNIIDYVSMKGSKVTAMFCLDTVSGIISKSHIFYPATPKGHMMSGKCEQPLHELADQVWLLYHHPNFKYYTLHVTERDGITDRRTIRLLAVPGEPFRLGNKHSK